MLSFLVLLVASNIFFMNKMNNDLMAVDEHQSQKLYLILQLEEIVRERSLSMLTMFMSDDPWFRDSEYMRFHKMAADFILLREKLERLGLTETEQTHFGAALDMIRSTEALQNSIVEKIHSGELDNMRKEISEVDMPLETELHKTFNSLTEEVRLNGQQARIRARKENITTLYISVVASGIVLISLFLLMRNSLYSLRNIEEELIDKTESLDWDASHDHLTRTLNRRGLIQKLSGMKNTGADGATHSLIYIDLDDFKPVNDRFGHDVGDLFLCAITDEFHTCIRKHDAIARIGGDEFALFLEDCDPDTAMRISRCLLDKARTYSLQHEQQTVGISGCSVGIYSFTSTDADLDTLLKRADSACYESKRQGKNQITTYKA
jgi:diguanylate cyclase (GGDEF)-like protein